MCGMRVPSGISQVDVLPRWRGGASAPVPELRKTESLPRATNRRSRYSFQCAGALVFLLPLWISLSTVTVAQGGGGGAIAGRIRDRTGAELANVSVTLIDKPHNFQQTSTTNALGGYRFAGLPPGSYEIEANTGAPCRTVVTASVVADETTPSDLVLKDCSDSRGMTFPGAPRLPDPNGAPSTWGVRPGSASIGAGRLPATPPKPSEPTTAASIAPSAPASSAQRSPAESEPFQHEHMHRRPSAPSPEASGEQAIQTEDKKTTAAPPSKQPVIQPTNETVAAPPQNKPVAMTPRPSARPAQEAADPGKPSPSLTDPNGSTDAAEESWFAGLKQSRLDWDVPAVMVLNETRLITVRVYGYQDPSSASDALPGSTGGSALKVATQMSAELISAGGDDMQVTPAGAAGAKYVPATGFTDWSWKVTPVHSAKLEKLKLTVGVALNASHSRSFVTYSRPFEIAVVSAGSAKDYTEDHFWSLLKYWGPGGAGFLAAAGLFQWWRKRPRNEVSGVGPVAKGGR